MSCSVLLFARCTLPSVSAILPLKPWMASSQRTDEPPLNSRARTPGGAETLPQVSEKPPAIFRSPASMTVGNCSKLSSPTKKLSALLRYAALLNSSHDVATFFIVEPSLGQTRIRGVSRSLEAAEKFRHPAAANVP